MSEPTIKTRIVKCNVRCGKFAKSPIKQMIRAGGRYGSRGTDPWGFRCAGCRCEWDGLPLADIREVSCSNCYGDNIRLVAIRIEI